MRLSCQHAACIFAAASSDSLPPLCLCPQVRDFVYISDRAYTRDQILNMEKIMLNALRFNLTVPSEWRRAAWQMGAG